MSVCGTGIIKTAGADGIDPTRLYNFPQFKRVSGLGEWGVRQLRRAGMPVRYVGGRGYVYGRDFIEHVVGGRAPESVQAQE